MTSKSLMHKEANELLRSLADLPVSLAWKGYGSAIFLELGQLSAPAASSRQPQGEANIAIYWDWRVEEGAKVLFGSSSSRPEIRRNLETLIVSAIDRIEISGEVPELHLLFKGGRRLRSATMVAGDPQWKIRLCSGNWLDCQEGVLRLGDGARTELTAAEAVTLRHAEATAKRWGVQPPESAAGRCGNCQHFVMLDGDFNLLDFGVCTSESSPHDRRATRVDFGCAFFAHAQEEP